MRISHFLIAGLLISFGFVGFGISINSVFTEYGLTNTNIGILNKTAQFEQQVDNVRTNISGSGVDSTSLLTIGGFKAASSIFKGFGALIDIFVELVQVLTLNIGAFVVPGWATALLISLVTLGIVFAILGLFIERDRI